MERLNRFLARNGVASRRNADKMIAQGQVKVNGEVVDRLGATINPDNDVVTCNGITVKAVKPVYIMFYKPKGCITTKKDELGRKTIFDYVTVDIAGLVPVGRLDYETEGLLLLTNDGQLAHALTHPSHEIPKTYVVKVEGEVPEHNLAQLRKGVMVDGVKTKRSKVKLLEYKDGISKIQVTIYEGRNRQIRKMFEAIDKEVIFLKRTAVADLRLGGLSRGGYRYLNEFEIDYLKRL